MGTYRHYEENAVLSLILHRKNPPNIFHRSGKEAEIDSFLHNGIVFIVLA